MIARLKRLLALATLLVSSLLPATAETLDIREAVTPSGLEFYYLHRNAQDRVAVGFAFPGGTAHDLMDGPQTSFLITELMMQSGGGVGIATLQEDIQDLQGGFFLRPAADYTLGGIEGPTADIGKIAELANPFLSAPDFPESKLEQLREDTARRMTEFRSRPDGNASLAFADALAKPHPYSANLFGDPARIQAVTRDDLVEWHKNRIVRDGLKIVVVGNLDEKTMAETVDTLFAGLPEKGELPQIPDIEALPAPETTIHVEAETGEQAILIAGGLSMTADDPKAVSAGVLLNLVLAGGPKSRLFKAVREETGNTYGLQGQLQAYRKAGSFVVTGRADKDGIDGTVAATRQALLDFRKDGPTKREEKDVKAHIAAEAARILKDHAKLAYELTIYAAYEQSVDELRRSFDTMQEVDLSDPAYREALIPEKPVFMVAE